MISVHLYKSYNKHELILLNQYLCPYSDKTLRLKAEFKNDSCALNLDTDFKRGGPILKAGAVLGYAGL